MEPNLHLVNEEEKAMDIDLSEDSDQSMSEMSDDTDTTQEQECPQNLNTEDQVELGGMSSQSINISIPCKIALMQEQIPDVEDKTHSNI